MKLPRRFKRRLAAVVAVVCIAGLIGFAFRSHRSDSPPSPPRPGSPLATSAGQNPEGDEERSRTAVVEKKPKALHYGKLSATDERPYLHATRRDVEEWLAGVGRTDESLSIACFLTGEIEYLNEALRELDNPVTALSLKLLQFPEKCGPDEIGRLRSILGTDDIFPDLAELYRRAKNGDTFTLEELAPIAAKRAGSDPFSTAVPLAVDAMMSLGQMSAADAYSLAESMLWRGPQMLSGELTPMMHRMRVRTAESGDPENTRDVLRLQAALYQHRGANWSLSGAGQAIDGEQSVLRVANLYGGVEGIWDQPLESVHQALNAEEQEVSSLIRFKEEILPALPDDIVYDIVARVGTEGEHAVWTELANRDAYRGTYEMIAARVEAEKRRMGTER